MNAPASTAPDVLGKLATMALHHGSEWERVHDAVAEAVEALRELSQCDGSAANVASAEILASRVRALAGAALARIGGAA